MPEENADKPELGTSEGRLADFTEWTEKTERLAADIRMRLQEADVEIGEYPQRQFMVPDMELHTVLEAIGPGGVHPCRFISPVPCLITTFPRRNPPTSLLSYPHTPLTRLHP